MRFVIFIVIGIIAFVIVFIISKYQKPVIKFDDLIEEERERGTIFFHEDDYCQIELIPYENFNELIKQADNISEFSSTNFVGDGWADMMVREGQKIKLYERGIPIVKLEEVLKKLNTQKHTYVETGYGSNYRVKSKNTIGFGKSYSAIYCNYSDRKVENIWMTNISLFNNEKVEEVLFQIGKKWDLLLMDWEASQLIDLKNRDQIKNYLK